jgi:hypothetical protein
MAQSDKKEDPQTQSRMLKAKKFIVSKGARSNMGQKAILHFLGTHGANLTLALQNAAARDCGEAKAKTLLENVYVLACKGKVLFDAKYITPANTRDMAGPINTLCISIFLVLEEKRKHPTKDVDVNTIALKFAQMEAMVLQLLKPLIKEKNLAKVSEVFKYFGSARFLSLLLDNPNYHEFKTTIHKNLKLLMVDKLEEASLMPPPRLCKALDCASEALDEDGKFAGSHYCGPHHERQYSALLKEPNVHHFIAENGFDFDPFVKMADKHFPPNSRMMYRGTQNFLETKPKIRKLFAEGLYEKYLAPNASHKVECLSAACVAAVRDTYQAAAVTCYDGCNAELLAVFTPIFKAHFLGSDAFKEYVSTRRYEREKA